MKKNTLFPGFLMLISLLLPAPATAQQADYEYSWATRGGGPRDLTSGIVVPGLNHSQKVTAIAIDEQNNYYFLCVIGSDHANTPATFGDILDPDNLIEIATYNDPLGSQGYNARDTYLVSTTCEGEFRWHKTIGGSRDIYAYGLGTDASGGVYVAGNHLQPLSQQIPVPFPVHFDQDTIHDSSMESRRKGIYLIKYDTEGNYKWLKEPRTTTDTDNGNDAVSGGEIYVEPDGTTHWLVVLPEGYTLENGAVEAESVHFPHSGFWDEYVGDVGVIRYDKDGNLLGYTRLDIAMHGRIGTNIGSEIPFAYDPVLERYYITAFHTLGGTPFHPAIIDETEITGQFYMAAFKANSGDLLWWHEINQNQGSWRRLRDIITDTQGNVYITGAFNATGGTGNWTYDKFAGYTFIPETGNTPGDPFMMKLDSNGEMVWVSYPGLTPNNNASAGSHGQSIALTDTEVIGGQGYSTSHPPTGSWHYWGNAYFERPSPGWGSDPAVVRLDKDTGKGKVIHDIVGAGLGDNDYITALAVDKLGNIVVGGILTSPYIFDDHPVVDEVWREGISKTDFFIAQLAKAGVSCDDEWVGVDDINKTSLQLYPNPAGETLHWEGDVDLTQITLYDLSGRVVLAQTVSGTSGALSIHTLSSGTYIVVLRDAAGTQLQQVLLKK